MHANEAPGRRGLEVMQAGDIAALANPYADDCILHYPGRNTRRRPLGHPTSVWATGVNSASSAGRVWFLCQPRLVGPSERVPVTVAEYVLHRPRIRVR